MSGATLLRLAALAAIIGGLLRGVDAFAFEFMTSEASGRLFLATDIFQLFGLIGLYVLVCRAAGWAGLAGFVIAVIGMIMMRSAGDSIDAYIYGTATDAAGMALLGLALMLRRAFPIWAPILWVVALLAGAASFPTESDWSLELASVAFGLGFVLAGAEIFRRAAANWPAESI
jgi:hypothetical protein